MIEVMASVLLTSIVISVAVAFQINLGTMTTIARERLRTQRQAVALLDRISRDLAGVYFIAAADRATGRANPWIFLSERHFNEEGESDAVKFITRNYQTQDLDGHHSDLAVVAYYLNPVEDSPGYQLMRWRKAHLPQKHDSSFPDLNDPDADVIGENLASFALTMIDQTGGELPVWDSRRFLGRAALPIGVKITISMLDASELSADPDAEDDEDEFDFADEDETPANTYSKTVLLPLRPLDWTFLESEARAGAATDAVSLAELAEEYYDEESEDADDDDDGFDDDDRKLRLDRNDDDGFFDEDAE
jgi:hypothetical protein